MSKSERDKLIQVFVEVAKLAGRDISDNQIDHDCLDAPHKRPREDRSPLVYIFILFGSPLKVGKSVAERGTRLGNHYNPGANAPLAKAILDCKASIKQVCPQQMHLEIDQLDKKGVGTWMENALTLVRFRFDRGIDPVVVELFEVFLQCKLRPLFEGTSRGWGSKKEKQSLDPIKVDLLFGEFVKSGLIEPK